MKIEKPYLYSINYSESHPYISYFNHKISACDHFGFHHVVWSLKVLALFNELLKQASLSLLFCSLGSLLLLILSKVLK